MTRAWSCRQEDTPGQPIESCPAKHLALEHLGVFCPTPQKGIFWGTNKERTQCQVKPA